MRHACTYFLTVCLVKHVFLLIILSFLFMCSFTFSPTKDVFQIRITAPGEQYTRVGVQLLDRRDGSFLVRYRMYASYKSLQIEVTFSSKHVADSPYFLEGILFFSISVFILNLVKPDKLHNRLLCDG